MNTSNKFSTALFFLLVLQLASISISIAVSSIAFGLMLLLLLVWSFTERRWLLARTPLDYFILVYIVIEFLTTITAVHPFDALHNTKRLLLILLVYVIILSFDSKRKILLSLKIISGVIALLSVFEISAYFFEHQDRLFMFQHYMTTGGLKMIIGLLLMPFLFNPHTPKKEKIFLAAAFIPVLLALMLTNTRSSWLGFLGGIILISALQYRKLFAALLIFIAAFFLFAPQHQVQRAKSIIDVNDPTNHARLVMWKTGWRIAHNYPLLGIGDTDIHYMYEKYKDADDVEGGGHLHNNFVTLLVTIGGIGLTIVLALFAKIISVEFSLFKKLKNDWLAGSIVLGSLAVFIGFLINGMFEWNFGDHEIMVFVWSSIGLVFAADRVSAEEK